MKPSDVVFMYQAKPEVYAAYGATVLAWGGRPAPSSLADAQGVKFYGSVGMVTEFARYYERFPQTYEAGLCRDLEGKPVKVPWLTDHQHKGIPYWWCCTQQPQFRQYLSERVAETIKAGADGLHIDDHLGTAGGLWLGICFCDRCLEGFRVCLKSLSPNELTLLGITQAETFDFRQAAKQWLAASPDKKRTVTQHPLWPRWTIYQCRAAAAFMAELHQLAERTAGHPVPMGANAGLLWPRHLIDYKTLDLFSAETDHHAPQERCSDLPLVAYRLADAVGRPYAATASGGDWAHIKERNLPGLVRGWIALSYAAGHCLMAPHRQWCYTPQKGTHWYQGPTEKFAPLYQFVRRNAALFDGYENHADLAVLVPHRAFARQPNRWFDICNQLAATNLSYRLLLAGDEIVDHPLSAGDWQSVRIILAPDEDNLLPGDREQLREFSKNRPVFKTMPEALAAAAPAVRVRAEGAVRVLPRVKPGSAALHVLNYEYEPARDDVRLLEHVKIIIDAKALGLSRLGACQFHRPDAPPLALTVKEHAVELPALGLWGVLVFQDP